MSRVLITGGAGFIGAALAQYLLEKGGCQVVLADNLARGRMDADLEGLLKNKNISFQSCDLTDRGQVEALGKDFDFVYHLAAILGVKNVMAHPDRVLGVNATAVLHLLDLFKASQTVQKIFFASTSEVYAGAVGHYNAPVPTPETTALVLEDIKQPRTSYALSKMFGESACFVYAAQYGLPVVLGRYHNVYGPRMGFAHVIPETFQKIARSATIDVPSAGHTRAFCYVSDAVDMTVRLTQDPRSSGGVFNIGNPMEEIRIVDLIKIIAAVQGHDIKINPLQAAQGSPARRCPDISSWEAMFGKKSFVSLRQGIEKTFAWYKNRLDQEGRISDIN